MPVPYTFGTATAAIPLSQLDSNFATAITLGNTAVYLGNTTTSLGNVTLTNVTISSGNVTVSNITANAITSPAATNLLIQSAGTTAVTIDTAQNVGLGVTPPTSTDAGNITIKGGSALNFSTASGNMAANATFNSSWKYIATAAAVKYTQSSGEHQFFNAPSGTAGNAITFTQAMTLDASGKLLLGVTTGTGLSNSDFAMVNGGSIRFRNAANSAYISAFYFTPSNGLDIGTGGSLSTITFGISGIGEVSRFDTSGNLLVGTTSDLGARFNVSTGTRAWAGWFQQVNNAGNSVVMTEYSTGAPNNSSDYFGLYRDNAAQRIQLRSNGGIANYTANNVNLSDRREKINFTPAKSYLDVICSIPVQTFNYIDQNLEEDGGLTLGVVAQDVQAVAPEMVMESNWGTQEEPKMRLSIYQTDLQYALMKCIQEQQALITQLTARITALEQA
jgi:hypothetical protein